MTGDLPSLPPRPRDAHKGSMGRVLLVAGSRGMAGAAALASEAVLRSGAGYAVAAVPGAISPEMTAAIPSAVLLLCGDAARGALTEEDADALLAEADRADAVAVGPGIGTRPATADLLRALLAGLRGRSKPTVVDADGLNLLARTPEPWSELLGGETILTPHPGEAARLLRSSAQTATPGDERGASAVQSDRPAALEALVQKTGCVVLLKGADTLVGAPGQTRWMNRTGNSGLATAGSGDVLTGIAAALLARGLPAWDAARLAAHLHGRAGDLAAAELGEDALIAGDLLRFLPAALREVRRASGART